MGGKVESDSHLELVRLQRNKEIEELANGKDKHQLIRIVRRQFLQAVLEETFLRQENSL